MGRRAGSRATVPDVDGLEPGPRVHTSDTIMYLAELPRSIIIFGGGFIAAEFAHVFDAFGSEVIQVIRGDRLLRTHDADISAAFTDAARNRWTLLSGTQPSSFRATRSAVEVEVAGSRHVADVVLVATGRIPNSALDVGASGIAVDPETGLVIVDEFQRTSVDGIFALGDISSPWELKHVANHEMRAVRHNLANPESMIRSDHRFVPSAVFTHPQIASVGLERGARAWRRVRERPLRLLRDRRRWARED